MLQEECLRSAETDKLLRRIANGELCRRQPGACSAADSGEAAHQPGSQHPNQQCPRVGWAALRATDLGCQTVLVQTWRSARPNMAECCTLLTLSQALGMLLLLSLVFLLLLSLLSLCLPCWPPSTCTTRAAPLHVLTRDSLHFTAVGCRSQQQQPAAAAEAVAGGCVRGRPGSRLYDHSPPFTPSRPRRRSAAITPRV